MILLALTLLVAAAQPAESTPFQEGDAAPEATEAPEADTTVEGVPSLPTYDVQPVGALPEGLRQLVMESRDQSLAQRMDAISATMLDRPHHDDPLGEGMGSDLDPLVRYDMYDCLTFVEEVLALSLAGDPEHAAEVRLDIRYAGSPSYTHRRHFMELQWLPDNLASGWIRDTTADYGDVVQMERTVDEKLWKNWAGRANFAHSDEELPVGPMRLNVLPLEQAIEAAPTLRPGSIIAAVREDRSYKPIWITHVGFVFDGPTESTRTLRHATRMKKSRRVRDHDLVWYLKLLSTYKNWKVAGIAVFEPIDASPRVEQTEG
ncbi:MAG: DUF1460 domain-containing protein [Proteobacteria bacterium]|nr:DUF1460 domain-containing protein [Pseudomonadota bacterium]